MAKLPSTIYKEIATKQKELYDSGETDGSISLLTAYAVFFDCGYKQSTANKWLLNWAISRCLRFEKDGQYYRIRLGQFHDMKPSECLNGVWLPVKEIWVTDENGKRTQGPVIS